MAKRKSPKPARRKRRYEVELPRYDVELYTVEATSKREALRLAKQLRASGSADFDVIAGSRQTVKELKE